MNLLVVFCMLICGCNQRKFDASKAGTLHFTHSVVSNGNPVQYEWTIPASDMQSILEHITAPDPQYDDALVCGSLTATMSYKGKEIMVSWASVKIADPVILLTIQGNRYMLVEPYAGEFDRLLEKHKKEISQQKERWLYGRERE
jgi:hypothetical protein